MVKYSEIEKIYYVSFYCNMCLIYSAHLLEAIVYSCCFQVGKCLEIFENIYKTYKAQLHYNRHIITM